MMMMMMMKMIIIIITIIIIIMIVITNIPIIVESLGCVKSNLDKALKDLSILYFPIAHNTLCLPPQFCINHCF